MGQKTLYIFAIIVVAVLLPLVPAFGVEIPRAVEASHVADKRLEKDFSLLVGDHGARGSFFDGAVISGNSRGLFPEAILLSDKGCSELDSGTVERSSFFSLLSEEVSRKPADERGTNTVEETYKYVHMTIGFMLGLIGSICGMLFVCFTQHHN